MALRKHSRRGVATRDAAVAEAPGYDPYATSQGVAGMARSKGALSGVLLMLLGIWGALIPFVGPSFDFGYTPDATWAWTAGRFWFEVLPGIVTIVGALLLLFSANRAVATLGAAAAAVSGAWFILAPVLAPELGIGSLGNPIASGGWERALTTIGLFLGLGAAILYLASTALGRLSVRGVRDVRAVERRHMKRRYAEPAVAETPAVATYEERHEAPAHASMTPRNGAADTATPDGEVRTDETERADGHVGAPAGRFGREA